MNGEALFGRSSDACTRRSNSRPRSGGITRSRGGVKPGHFRGRTFSKSDSKRGGRGCSRWRFTSRREAARVFSFRPQCGLFQARAMGAEIAIAPGFVPRRICRQSRRRGERGLGYQPASCRRSGPRQFYSLEYFRLTDDLLSEHGVRFSAQPRILVFHIHDGSPAHVGEDDDA